MAAADIIRLPDDEHAPREGNCITIERCDDDGFTLDGSALMACGDTDEVELISMIGSQPYDSYDEAEAAGFAWATEHCAGEVHVSTII